MKIKIKLTEAEIKEAVLGIIANDYAKRLSVKTLQVVDKYESSGKCFLLLEIETTPEEYIGYDIGDDYEITEME